MPMASAVSNPIAAQARELLRMLSHVVFLRDWMKNAINKKNNEAEPHAVGSGVEAAAKTMAKVVNIELSVKLLEAMLCRFKSMSVLYV